MEGGRRESEGAMQICFAGGIRQEKGKIEWEGDR